VFIRLLQKLRRKEEEKPAPPAPTKEQELLMEIRDLLKQHTKGEKDHS
jgi:large conductance mechanosensitive channel